MRPGYAIRVAFLASLALAGCDYHNDKIDGEISPLSRPVGFAEVRDRVLKPSCTNCHTTQNPQLDSYGAVVKATSLIRRTVFVDKSMPRFGQLSLDQKQLLLAWLNQGAPEGEPVPEPSPQPSSQPVKITWAEVKTRVYDVACNGCHFPGNPGNISDLTNLEYARATIGSSVGLALSDLMPPPDNARPLAPEQKRLLTEWWIAGLPEN